MATRAESAAVSCAAAAVEIVDWAVLTSAKTDSICSALTRTSRVPVRTSATTPSISSVARAVSVASSLTSPATTANPRPASPARAASMVAFRASRLVCAAMAVMVRAMSAIWAADSSSRRITTLEAATLAAAASTEAAAPVAAASISAAAATRSLITVSDSVDAGLQGLAGGVEPDQPSLELGGAALAGGELGLGQLGDLGLLGGEGLLGAQLLGRGLVGALLLDPAGVVGDLGVLPGPGERGALGEQQGGVQQGEQDRVAPGRAGRRTPSSGAARPIAMWWTATIAIASRNGIHDW